MVESELGGKGGGGRYDEWGRRAAYSGWGRGEGSEWDGRDDILYILDRRTATPSPTTSFLIPSRRSRFRRLIFHLPPLPCYVARVCDQPVFASLRRILFISFDAINASRLIRLQY